MPPLIELINIEVGLFLIDFSQAEIVVFLG